jgi:DME family drug/metabolite transporter
MAAARDAYFLLGTTIQSGDTLTGVGFAVYQTAYYIAIPLTGLTVATVVTLGSGPVLIALGARLFLGERLGALGSLTVLASLAGLVLLTGVPGAAKPLGVAVALLSALGYAIVTLVGRASRSDDDPLDTSLGGFLVGAVCLTPLAIGQPLLPHTAYGIGLILFLGAVPTAAAYALFFAGLTAVPATTASVVALIEPVAATLLGVVVLHEHLPLLGWLGASVLLAAVAVLARAEE